MNKEELIEALTKVRPEILTPEAFKLFECVTSILDENEKLREEKKVLNKMNEQNYEKYCNELKKKQDLIKYLETSLLGLKNQLKNARDEVDVVFYKSHIETYQEILDRVRMSI